MPPSFVSDNWSHLERVRRNSQLAKATAREQDLRKVKELLENSNALTQRLDQIQSEQQKLGTIEFKNRREYVKQGYKTKQPLTQLDSQTGAYLPQ